MKPLPLLLLLSGLTALSTVAATCCVESAATGDGWFRYTFSHGDSPVAWGFSTNYGAIQLQSAGILEVREPAGWTHSISASGLIEWRVAQGTACLDEPLAFEVRTCLSGAAPCGPLNPDGSAAGFIFAMVVEWPSRTPTLYSGYQPFTFTGPARPALALRKEGAQLVAAWPAAAPGCVLEETACLGPDAHWTPVAPPPSAVDGGMQTRLDPARPAAFYRLAVPAVAAK